MPLDKLPLPTVLRATAELIEATNSYCPEDHPEILAAQAGDARELSFEMQFRWHDALDAIRDAANRLKRALGATGELRPGRVRAETTPAAWRHFDSNFLDLDYARSVRVGLRRMALAAVDLSGYAELKEPPVVWRHQAFAQLGRGIIQIWPALSLEEAGETRPLLPLFRQTFGWSGLADQPPPTWSGPIEIAHEEEYRCIDLSSYTARTKTYANDLSLTLAHQSALSDPAQEQLLEEGTPKCEDAQVQHKKSTAKGEGQLKLIAALSKHHGYDNGSVSTTVPINNNQLAKRAKVDKATASAFFKKHFGGHEKYRLHYCNQQAVLAAALKSLNGEYTTDELFGGKLPEECDRDEE